VTSTEHRPSLGTVSGGHQHAVVDPGHPSWACRVNWWPGQVPELAA